MYTCPQCNQIAFLPECENCCIDPEHGDAIQIEHAALTRRRLRVRPLPNPFRTRLASFLGREDSEVMTEYSQDSKMPFQIYTTIEYIGTRPIELLRQILIRIKELANRQN